MFEQLDNFAREHLFLSVILFGLITNIISFLLKNFSLLFLKISVIYTKKLNQKRAKAIIRHYQNDIEVIRKIQKDDAYALKEIINTLHNNFLILIMIIVLLLIVDQIDNRTIFISSMAISSWKIIEVFVNTQYNVGLLKKAKDFNKYKKRIEEKISYWQKVIKQNST